MLLLVLGLILGSGWYFGFSDAWKTNISIISGIAALVILIFLQKSQNHSDKATHLKLDELIQASKRARDEIIAAEEQSAKDMDDMKR